MNICDAVLAVESQAPSSNPSDSPPRTSGRPIENRRPSTLASSDPSSTAPTAKNGCTDTAPAETGPAPMTRASAGLAGAIARARCVGVDARRDRHAGQQALEQWLPLVELDADRHAL